MENAWGLRATSYGNHEFDFGVERLLRQQERADFPFLATNIVETATGRAPPWVTPSAVFTVNGVRVGVIGAELENTPELVSAGATAGLSFLDEAPRIRAESEPGLHAPLRGEQPGEITWGEMFSVLPFGNRSVILTLTGAQLETAFLNGFAPRSSKAGSSSPESLWEWPRRPASQPASAARQARRRTRRPALTGSRSAAPFSLEPLELPATSPTAAASLQASHGWEAEKNAQQGARGQLRGGGRGVVRRPSASN